MIRIYLPETAHGIVRRHLTSGGIAVDATLGNGYDTEFLARCVGENGHVFGFDIQSQALFSTLRRLQLSGLEGRATLFHASHAEMHARIPEKLRGRVQAVMFNLGYLPGADKSVTTQTRSTLEALNAACSMLAEQGVITVLAYPGHAGGDQETETVSYWCGQLEQQQFQVEIILSNHHQPIAPRLFVIRKQANLL